MNDIPTRASTLTPYLCTRRCAEAIDWYAEVLGAVEEGPRFVGPDGLVGHAQVRFGGTDGPPMMLSDAAPDIGVVAPDGAREVVTYSLHLEVADADATVAAAEGAGATVQRPVTEQFHGARTGVVLDPFGVRWMISTPVREVDLAEMARAADAFAAAPDPGTAER